MRSISFRSHHSRRGVSLLELLMVISIIAVLGTFASLGLGYFRRRSQDVACMGNLRGIHAALASYLNENDQVWPQDAGMDDANREESEEVKFWYETLKSYGPNRGTWLCPADKRGSAVDNDSKVYDSSYTVTQFDEERGTAYKWMNQPWLVERGGFHGEGEINEALPDGSIRKSPGPPP
jgi:prepilin-type N-terminal cleavage/methylation domain-containing protein